MEMKDVFLCVFVEVIVVLIPFSPTQYLDFWSVQYLPTALFEHFIFSPMSTNVKLFCQARQFALAGTLRDVLSAF